LRLLQWEVMCSVFMGSIIFSLISSFVYINNDIKDAEEDALHPRKRNRPIAAGLISKQRAFHWNWVANTCFFFTFYC
jgi:4-hydroxybenzoate polyprenyltransferase